MNLYKSYKGIDRFFEISKRGSTFTKEIVGGILVFFATIYILPVNSSVLSNLGVSEGGLFIATAIATSLSTMLMGLVAKLPLVMSTSMGMNAYIAFTVSQGFGFTPEQCFAVTMVTGILFFICSVTPLRMMIVNAIPKSLKLAISAGLGFFICFVGLQMGGIIINDGATLVKLASFNPNNGNGHVLLAVFGILLTIALNVSKVKILKQFSLIISLFVTAFVGGIVSLCYKNTGINVYMPEFISSTSSSLNSLKEFKDIVFIGFKGLVGNESIFLKPQTYGVILSLLIVNIFDTTATLVGLGPKIGLIDRETNKMVNYKKAFISDGISPFVSGCISVSPTATFAESSVGVEYGARTGLAAVTTSLLFLVAMFAFPLFNCFLPIQLPDGRSVTPVTCSSLVMVGSFMFVHLKDIDWKDPIVVVSSFLTVIMMLVTYSLTDGIAFGVISYTLMMLVSKRRKEISVLMYVLSSLLIANFVVTAILSGS